MSTAANDPFRLPPRLFDARCTACWFTLGIVVLIVASFWSLDLQWRAFFSGDLKWLKHYGFAMLDVPTLGGGLSS